VIGVTAALAAAFAGFVLIVRPSFALGVIIFAMMIYPEFMRIPVGPAAMSVPRMAALALLLKLMVMGRHKKTEFHKVDKLVIALWVWLVIAAAIAGGEYTQMIGRVFDTVVMYFAARYAITSVDDFKKLFVPLAFTAVVMGILGAVESATTKTLYATFERFLEARATYWKGDEFRYGFLRAKASTAVHIYFGMAMVILTGFAWSMRGYVRPGFINYIVLPVAFVGALSSMSSGPWLAAIFLLVFNAYVARISLIKPSLWLLLFACIAMELGSNRHFYHLIEYIALSEVTAWYRVRLMEVFFSNWTEFWLFGTGSDPLVHWATQLDGRDHLDIVNYFVLLGVYGGFMAMYLYIASHVIAIRRLSGAYFRNKDKKFRNLVFGLGATLISIDAACLSASLFGPPLLMTHILLGMIISVTLFDSKGPKKRKKSVYDDFSVQDSAQEKPIDEGIGPRM